MQEDNFSIECTPAILVLEDGSVFLGTSVGALGTAVGEVVFNTSMTGYQEILTDPSYARQMVTLTYPHIGNVGVNPEDMESPRVWAAGLIMRSLSPLVSSWRATEALPTFLARQGTVAIADIDTRRLTRLLREKGALKGCIIAGDVDPDKALALARDFPGIEGLDLASEVTRSEPETYAPGKKRVVVYDFGVKRAILDLIAARGYEVFVVPAKTPADEVIAMKPHAVLLSNGPGDPAACDYAITATQKLLDAGIRLFGICLGCQILALACGARTVKMKFGHHGANHPVQDLETGRVAITSQNHGFAIDEESLPEGLEVTHRSLFDNTIQGIRLGKRVFAFQGHPEASPGPHDIYSLFSQID